MSPSTSLQVLAWKNVQLSQRCSPLGVSWYCAAFLLMLPAFAGVAAMPTALAAITTLERSSMRRDSGFDSNFLSDILAFLSDVAENLRPTALWFVDRGQFVSSGLLNPGHARRYHERRISDSQ